MKSSEALNKINEQFLKASKGVNKKIAINDYNLEDLKKIASDKTEDGIQKPKPDIQLLAFADKMSAYKRAANLGNKTPKDFYSVHEETTVRKINDNLNSFIDFADVKRLI